MKYKFYTDSHGTKFEVTFVDHTVDGSWVHYRNTETNQEYNCRSEAFKARFTPVEESR